jgi:predicted flavoprotein YhiN
MHAALLIRLWRQHLSEQGASWHFGHELIDFESTAEGKVVLKFSTQGQPVEQMFDAVVLALGGGSYEQTPVQWADMFSEKNIRFNPFTPSNVGFRVNWQKEFLKEADGQPLKNIRLISSKGERLGDLVVTEYGLEGTPIYFVGETGTVYLDLKPDLSADVILEKCLHVKENLSPLRRIQKRLHLGAASEALLYHHLSKDIHKDLNQLVQHIKRFPIELLGPQPLSEAISSKGGIDLSEIDDSLMLIKAKSVFLAGEMLDWDAPTGGFLIQGCVSQGYRAGHSLVTLLQKAQSGEANPTALIVPQPLPPKSRDEF